MDEQLRAVQEALACTALETGITSTHEAYQFTKYVFVKHHCIIIIFDNTDMLHWNYVLVVNNTTDDTYPQ
jgi:hypothetical protein